MKRLLALILLILSAFSHGQDRVVARSLGQQVVEANEIDVGWGTRLLQAASIALNPRQENTRWPLFAYRFNEVLSTRNCNSFGNVPAGHELAFVSPARDIEMTRKLIGVQVAEADEIRDVCTRIAESASAFAEELNALLLEFEAHPANLQYGVIDVLNDTSRAQNQLNSQCMTPLLLGTVQHAASVQNGTTAAMIAGEPDPASWQGFLAESDGVNITIDWAEISSSGEELRQLRGILADAGYTAPIWHFRPNDPHHIAGMFFLTGRNLSAQAAIATADVSWNGGHIRWPEMPISENGAPTEFTMWYAPPFCIEENTPEWYLVSDRPLQIIESDFRTNMFSLDTVVQHRAASILRSSMD